MHVKLQAPTWEFNFRAHVSDLGRLRPIHEADWAARRSLHIGESAGAPVHWSISGDTITAMVGPDDESWDVAFLIPLVTIDRLTVEAASFPPEP